MQYHFGTGTLWGTATSDAYGNTIANPSPIKFGTIGDVTLDMSRDIKELYGQLAFPVAVGGGKMKIECKVKFAQISGRVYNDLFLGQGMSTGTLTAASEDLTGQAIPGAGTLTITPPNAGTFVRDLGVLDAGGVAMQRVSSAPATGQYSLSAGVYSFAVADAGKTVYVSYTYSYALAGAKTLQINNITMGTVPVFGLDLSCRYQGKSAAFRLNNCVSKKLTFDPKQDDFAMNDMDVAIFADPVTGAVGQMVFTE